MEPECYQLKWHSFEAHMQACVATLLHSETFADVVLSTADGRHISGHRFVLAASSTYLQRLLGQGSMVAHNHLPVVVILPPEVTYHALCLLVKYMYSGEATVPNSQLSAVLRAGDILKVRGLWRPNQHGGGGHGPHGPTAAPGASASAGVTASGRPHHIVEAMQNCMRRGPGAPPAVAGFHAARERERPAASSRAARAARQDYAASSATSAAASAASAAGLGVHRHFMDPSSIPVRAGHRHGPTAGLDMTSADDAGRGAGREVGHEDPEHAAPHPRPRGPGRPPLHQSRLASRRGVKDYRDSKDDIKARRREVRRRERIHLAARAAAAAAAAPAEKPVANGILGSVQAPDEHPGLQQAEKAAVADKDKEGGPDVKVEGAEERTTKREPDRSVSPRRGVSPRSVSPRGTVSARSVSPRGIVSPKASPRGSAGDDSGCEDRDDPGRTKPCKDEDGDGARTILDGIGALANLVVGEMRIKEEPIEWDLESEVREALLDDDRDGGRDHDPELHVKPEAMDTGEADGERGDGLLYSPLSCEICQVTFYSPAEWVRHAESEHGELRRRPRRRAHKGRQSSHDSDRSAMSASRAASTSSERTNAGTPGPAGSAASAGSSSGVTTPASAASSSGTSAPLRPRLGGQGLGQGGQGPYAELVCDVCDETFSSPALWARHMQSSHTDEELAVHNRAVRPSQPLRTYGPRVPHHHPSRNYASNNNNSSSSSSGSGSSSRHQGHGHGPPGSNKPLKTTLKRCGMCSKAFLSKASLQIHRRTHTGERPFVCHRCGYGFSVKSNLVRHIRTLHNGDDLNGDPQDPQDPALQDALDDPVGGGGGSGFDDEGCGDGDGDATNGTE